MTTFTSQPDDTTGIDTFIYQDAPTTNEDGAADLYIGESNAGANRAGRVLIKFDLSSIPPSSSIVSAVLTLTTRQDFATNTRTMRAYRQKRAWVETQATWNKYDSANNWQTAGGFGANDCEQTDIGSVSVANNTSLNTAVNISLTPSAIQEMVSGAFTNNGFLLKMDTETDDMFTYHPSSSATSTYRPKLVIEYTAGSSSGIIWFM